MIDDLLDRPRLVVDAEMASVAGSAIQPTGFPDLGASIFQRGGVRNLLVESVQSCANHAEALCWNGPAQQPVELLTELPWVRVAAEDGAFLSSSRLEPHRLAGAYIRDAQIDGKSGADWITDELGLVKGRPLDWPAIYRAIYQLDPLCLIHGVFFSDKRWINNPKVRRALTVVIEAYDVEEVVSGGVKRDDVSAKADKEGARGAKEGYGFVPFGRTEYVAEEICLTASLDIRQIEGYGLGDEATRLLELVALWEVAGLLEEPLRLRTACDLEAIEGKTKVRKVEDAAFPARSEIERELASLSPSFDQPGLRNVVHSAKTS